MTVSYVGELAALGAASVWSFSSLLFTMGGRRVGALVVNRTRLVFAVLLVGTAHWLTQGRAFPTGVEPFRYAWLSASALVGLVIGDTLLFQCYVLVGARIGVLLFTLSPVFGAILAWAFLGERLSLTEVLAIALTLAGVLWVVLERGGGETGARPRGPGYVRGLLFGVGANLCQALNLVLAKQGLVGGFSSLSAVMIRMSVAMVVIWVIAALQGEFGRTIRKVRADRRAALAIFGGSVAGPFIGVWLSLTAVQSARVGIASTLMALTPVLSLPLVRWVLRERISPRALLGTLVAMAGVAMMFLV